MSNAQKVFNSALFSVSAKILSKALGLISTVIIARILAPEDFGLIAIISMALYFFDILSHAAGEQYIVQKRSVSKDDQHTAWTLNLLLKLAIAGLLALCSPLIAKFFDRPELTGAFAVSGFVLIFQSLKSPSLMLLKRQLKFEPLFWLQLSERLLALPLLVGLAWWLRSFFAFLLADIVIAGFGATLSYILIGGKPRFSLKRIRQQWHFSQWMLGKSVLGYMRSQVDTLFVAKFFSSAQLGQFHMARDLAMMPAHYLLSPAIEPLLAVFKNNKDNRKALLADVSFCLFVVLMIGIPICAGLVILAKPIVLIILGSQWTLAAELLPILAFLFLYWSVAQVLEAAFVAQERVKWLFGYDMFSLGLVALLLTLGVFTDVSISQLACLRVVGGSAAMLVMLYWLYKGHWSSLRFSPKEYWQRLMRLRFTKQ